MPHADEIEGLVLCRVGDHQIAFPASTVEHIDQWELGGSPVPHARAVFGLPASAGKLLVHGGHSLVVDGLEVVADRARLLPVPAMLVGAVGGALRGFIVPQSALADQQHAAGAVGATSSGVVPLLGLAEFSVFVGTP